MEHEAGLVGTWPQRAQWGHLHSTVEPLREDLHPAASYVSVLYSVVPTIQYTAHVHHIPALILYVYMYTIYQLYM